MKYLVIAEKPSVSKSIAKVIGAYRQEDGYLEGGDVKDFYSTKKDKTFAADLVMRVEDGRAQYSLEFPKTPMKTKT